MSGKESVSVSKLVEYMKSLEDEMRDIRQRLEQIERGMEMSKYTGDKSIIVEENLSKIEPIAKNLLIAIESSKPEKAKPLKLLTVPDVPQKLFEIQSVLNELSL